MKEYIKLEICMKEFAVEDIITVSGDPQQGLAKGTFSDKSAEWIDTWFGA